MPLYLLLVPSRSPRQRRPAPEPVATGSPAELVSPPSLVVGEPAIAGGTVLRAGEDHALINGRDGELDPGSGSFA